MVDSIERIETSDNDFLRGTLNDTVTSNNTVVLAFEDEAIGEYKEKGYRLSPQIRFKYKGIVEISLAKTVIDTPDGTWINLEISTDGGDTWKSVRQGGSVTITTETPTTIQMRAKQSLFTNIEQVDGTLELDGTYEIIDTTLQENDDVAKVFEETLGIIFPQDNTITPELDAVNTTITLIDGKLREIGQILFQGKFWSQDIENGTL